MLRGSVVKVKDSSTLRLFRNKTGIAVEVTQTKRIGVYSDKWMKGRGNSGFVVYFPLDDLTILEGPIDLA